MAGGAGRPAPTNPTATATPRPMRLSGIFPPVTTPFDSYGGVDFARFTENLSRYGATRLGGFLLNGSTGESVLLRWTEIYRIWEVAREKAAAGKILIAGTGAESTPETIEHTNRAASLGFDFALVRTPNYYKPAMSVEAEATHFLRVADAARIPILLYSVPVFTGYTIEAPLVARVAHHENIVGMKDSSGSVERVAEILAVAPERFRLLVGSASTLEPSLAKGACGAILALACAFPELCCEIYDSAQAGDIARAQELQKLLAAPSALLGAKYGIAGLKYALDRLGYFGGPVRGPLMPLDEAGKQEIDALLASMTSAARAS
jgi:4-hydroxy-2-oxoglutarate aldolase